jgi:polysaccharide export outer membrane protein
MRLIYLILVVLLLAVTSSCSYRQNQVLFEHKPGTTDTTDQNLSFEPYKIQSQDILQIRNLQNMKYIVDEPASSAGISKNGSATQGEAFQVSEDGTVTLPGLGHVQVAGLTRSQAEKLIEDLYRKSLLKDPIIELKLINLKITMLGEVKAPGNFPLLKDNTTLVEMIGAAGGLTPQANEKNIKIIRGKSKNKKVTEVDLSDISASSDPRSFLQNGDIIYIAQNKRAIRAENLQSLNTWVQPALLLLNTALIIFTLSRQ